MIRSRLAVGFMLVFLGFLIAVTARSAAPPVVKEAPVAAGVVDVDIEGYYVCTGTPPGGGDAYEGIITISQRGAVYRAIWVFENGFQVGVGLRKGNELVIGFSAAGGGTGVARFQIEKDAKDRARMTGVWSVVGGPPATGEETLTYLKGLTR